MCVCVSVPVWRQSDTERVEIGSGWVSAVWAGFHKGSWLQTVGELLRAMPLNMQKKWIFKKKTIMVHSWYRSVCHLCHAKMLFLNKNKMVRQTLLQFFVFYSLKQLVTHQSHTFLFNHTREKTGKISSKYYSILKTPALASASSFLPRKDMRR